MEINKLPDLQSFIGDKVFTVSEFLEFLNQILRPCYVVIQGEVGERIDERAYGTYFSLLDNKKESVLPCLIWKNKLDSLGVSLEPGMEIQIIGYPEVYKASGSFNFKVESISLVGEGELKKQFEILKKKLEREGIFSDEFKKPIPVFVKKIGLITSQYGRGAKQDFLTHLGRYGFEIYFFDVRVEGMSAINEICSAIKWFNENMPDLDVLVLTRGGGSWESLKAFNSEEVVRAVFASRIPMIVGVGHEADTTLADLAADFRASTPTHAARILNENWRLAHQNILHFEERIFSSLKSLFRKTEDGLGFLKKNLREKMERTISLKKERVKLLKEELTKNKQRWMENVKRRIEEGEKKLLLSDPYFKLKQGYTITRDKNGNILKSPAALKIEQQISTEFSKGRIFSQIKKVVK